jgi:hypothetical protein
VGGAPFLSAREFKTLGCGKPPKTFRKLMLLFQPLQGILDIWEGGENIEQKVYSLVWEEGTRLYRAYADKTAGSFYVTEREAMVMVALGQAHYCN